MQTHKTRLIQFKVTSFQLVIQIKVYSLDFISSLNQDYDRMQILSNVIGMQFITIHIIIMQYQKMH